MRWAQLVLAAAVSMSVTDFIELQKLAAPDLRTRFNLPASCEPSLAALTTDAAANQLIVDVDCRPSGGAPPPASSPANAPSRRRPGKNTGE